MASYAGEAGGEAMVKVVKEKTPMRKKRNKAFLDELTMLARKKQPEIVGNPGPDSSGSTPVDTEKPSPLLQELQRFDEQVGDFIKSRSFTAD